MQEIILKMNKVYDLFSDYHSLKSNSKEMVKHNSDVKAW